MRSGHKIKSEKGLGVQLIGKELVKNAQGYRFNFQHGSRGEKEREREPDLV